MSNGERSAKSGMVHVNEALEVAGFEAEVGAPAALARVLAPALDVLVLDTGVGVMALA